MTNNTEQTKPSNKKLWLILAGISITVIGTTLAFSGMSSNSPKSPDDAAPSQSVSQDVRRPTIENVKVSVDAKELLFAVKVKDVDTTKWSVEYEIADQDRVVKDSGKVRTTEFDTSLKVSSSAYYRVKVRALNDDGAESAWSEDYTVKLADLEGMKTVKPAQAYYETGWAKGTDRTLDGAKTAIETAWKTTEITQQNAVSRCLPINSGDMTPTLLLPPLPSVLPDKVELKYFTNSWDGSAISITYLWCQ